MLVEAGASGPSRLQLACGENRLQLRWRAAPGGATRMRALDMSGSAAEGRIRMLALLIHAWLATAPSPEGDAELETGDGEIPARPEVSSAPGGVPAALGVRAPSGDSIGLGLGAWYGEQPAGWQPRAALWFRKGLASGLFASLGGEFTTGARNLEGGRVERRRLGLTAALGWRAAFGALRGWSTLGAWAGWLRWQPAGASAVGGGIDHLWISPALGAGLGVALSGRWQLGLGGYAGYALRALRGRAAAEGQSTAAGALSLSDQGLWLSPVLSLEVTPW